MFDNVLQQVLALSVEDRRRIQGVLNALDKAQASPGSTASEHPPGASLDEATNYAIRTEEQELTEWLQTGSADAPYVQLVRIDTAISQCETEQGVEVLQAYRRRLLEDNPAVAVRASVVKLGAERPLLLVGGVIGLIVGIVAIGQGIFRSLF
ncbi:MULTISPECIES: hypothetical protein [unclassified Hydrogenophaga]|uniref:hypothetical protein n=1 Tax=unclassified Hydrogenophaga TaxID=2610897 RepID=UPI00131F7AE3|nr:MULTISPECIES: hypothetical protein [unclassified Hydrogenophaga]MDP3350472.1 hypothetical protein [Hydrogenophaga sp.]QHE78592.1 hypothetical protein F9Z45_20800 [Hydrogenophaga sp. PBL-H3]QHE83017.1 hypothetical protein F9Z44_20800 [Hydrogenophaga sp. PBL-H3]